MGISTKIQHRKEAWITLSNCKKISCTTTEIVLQSLTEEFFEKPIWLGEGSDSLYSIFVSKNGSWTIIQFNNQIACVIGVGKSSKQIYLNTNR